MKKSVALLAVGLSSVRAFTFFVPARCNVVVPHKTSVLRSDKASENDGNGLDLDLGEMFEMFDAGEFSVFLFRGHFGLHFTFVYCLVP